MQHAVDGYRGVLAPRDYHIADPEFADDFVGHREDSTTPQADLEG